MVQRRRQQSGHIFKARGQGKLPPRQIEDEAKRIVSTACAANVAPDRVLKIGDFVDRVYFRHVAAYKRQSTLKGYKDLWRLHFKPLCADSWLREVRTCDIQSWLDTLGQGRISRNSLKHAKSFLSAVFKVAKQQAYFDGENPVRDTAVNPKAAEPGGTYAYSLDEIQRILAALPERAAAVRAKDGLMAVADGGTIFLDEVGELPVDSSGQTAAFAVAAFAGLRRACKRLWQNSKPRCQNP